MNQQKQIMNRQTDIMDAGYTPIIGVIEEKVNDHSSDDTVPENESVGLTIVNRGNSLATDLELHFLISYNTDNQRYINRSGSLRRTEDGVWWHSGTGGSISPEESETEFSVPAKVTDTGNGQDQSINISDAINQIFESEDDVNQIRIATQLHYKDAKGNPKTIDLTIYKIRRSHGVSDLKLSNATDRAVDGAEEANQVEEIKA